MTCCIFSSHRRHSYTDRRLCLSHIVSRCPLVVTHVAGFPSSPTEQLASANIHRGHPGSQLSGCRALSRAIISNSYYLNLFDCFLKHYWNILKSWRYEDHLLITKTSSSTNPAFKEVSSALNPFSSSVDKRWLLTPTINHGWPPVLLGARPVEQSNPVAFSGVRNVDGQWWLLLV